MGVWHHITTRQPVGISTQRLVEDIRTAGLDRVQVLERTHDAVFRDYSRPHLGTGNASRVPAAFGFGEKLIHPFAPI